MAARATARRFHRLSIPYEKTRVMKSYLGAIVENRSRMRRESCFSGGRVRRNSDYNRRNKSPFARRREQLAPNTWNLLFHPARVRRPRAATRGIGTTVVAVRGDNGGVAAASIIFPIAGAGVSSASFLPVREAGSRREYPFFQMPPRPRTGWATIQQGSTP